MNKSIPIAIICSLAALVGVDQTALAQAGSTGGTLGKSDKSASGGEEKAPGYEKSHKRPAQTKRVQDQPRTSSACGRIVGTWKWSNGLDVVFMVNGTGEATNGDTSTWLCEGGFYKVTWKAWGTDRITIASDGQSLSGVGIAGLPLSATRK
jgi:hypothetical protein